MSKGGAPLVAVAGGSRPDSERSAHGSARGVTLQRSRPPRWLGDDDLYRGFESARLPKEAFGHREHVRAAFLYLRRFPDFGEAAVRFRAALKRFAARHGDPALYHETLTWAYLALINERLQSGHATTSRGFLLRHPDLLDHRRGALARYYDVPRITGDDAARHAFVLPAARNRGRRLRRT